MPDARAETIANIIVNQWIARYGCPIFIHTDNATDFISNLNKETWRLMGITHQLATPYSPWANGHVERTNATIMKMLSTLMHNNETDWDQVIHMAMFAYRTSPNRINNFSPYVIIFGEEPCTPFTASLAQAPVMATPQDILDRHTTEFAKTLYKRMATAWSIVQQAEQAYRTSASPTTEGWTHDIRANRCLLPSGQICSTISTILSQNERPQIPTSNVGTMDHNSQTL
jgi:transposase InsO family protein